MLDLTADFGVTSIRWITLQISAGRKRESERILIFWCLYIVTQAEQWLQFDVQFPDVYSLLLQMLCIKKQVHLYQCYLFVNNKTVFFVVLPKVRPAIRTCSIWHLGRSLDLKRPVYLRDCYMSDMSKIERARVVQVCWCLYNGPRER